MGTKTNPGQFDCYAAAEPDEPMFILLARDPLAPILVRLWVVLRRMFNPNWEKETEANKCAFEMEQWRREHNETG